MAFPVPRPSSWVRPPAIWAKAGQPEPPCRDPGAVLGGGCGGQQIPCKLHLKNQAYVPCGQPKAFPKQYKTPVLTTLARNGRTLKRLACLCARPCKSWLPSGEFSKPGNWSWLSSTREGIYSSYPGLTKETRQMPSLLQRLP